MLAVVVIGVGAVVLPVPPVSVVYHNRPVPVAVNAVAVLPKHKLRGDVTVGAVGTLFTITAIELLGLSQVVTASVCVTKKFVVPAVAVLGVGAVVLDVPPVATVYHLKPVPVAVSAVAEPLKHKLMGVVTTGLEGSGLTVTAINSLGPSQPNVFDWLTKKLVVPAVVVVGIGAVVLLVPPVATVYHFKLVPVAVNAVAVEPMQ